MKEYVSELRSRNVHLEDISAFLSDAEIAEWINQTALEAIKDVP